MPKKVKTVQQGYHTVTPSLAIQGCAGAIEFYKKAFDAAVLFRKDNADGKVMYASIKIKDSVLMIADDCDPHPEHEQNCAISPTILNGTTVKFYLNVEDVDDFFEKAVRAGALIISPVSDILSGDRTGALKDPYGHLWTIATRKENLSNEELEERADEFFKQKSSS